MKLSKKHVFPPLLVQLRYKNSTTQIVKKLLRCGTVFGSVVGGEVYFTLILFSNETWLYLSWYLKRYTSRSVAVWLSLLCDAQRVTQRLINTFLISETTNAGRYFTYPEETSWKPLPLRENRRCFQQDSADVRTTNNYIRCLRNVFDYRITQVRDYDLPFHWTQNRAIGMFNRESCSRINTY